MEHSFQDSEFVQTLEYQLTSDGPYRGKRVVWAGDHSDLEPETPFRLYDFLERLEKPLLPVKETSAYPFILNHSKRMYVDKRTIPQNGDGCFIHPLPLLTAEGNANNVGDYVGENDDLVGFWSRDKISVVKTLPEGYSYLNFAPRESKYSY